MEIKINDNVLRSEPHTLNYIVGANGYGKSTLLRNLLHTLDNNRNVMDFSDSNVFKVESCVHKDIHYFSNKTVYGDFEPVVVVHADVSKSHDYHTVLGYAMTGSTNLRIDEFVELSESYQNNYVVQHVFKTLDIIEQVGYDKDVVVILDGIDSGQSIDVAEYTAKQVMDYVNNSPLNIHLFATINSYDWIVTNPNVTCLDARTLESKTFDSYDAFRQYVRQTSVLNDVVGKQQLGGGQ